MGVQGVSGPAVAAAAAGALLIWSGIKGASVTQSLRSLASGQAPSGAEVTALTTGNGPAGAAGGPSLAGGPGVPGASANVAANVVQARLMAAAYGWIGQEWQDLYALWTRESGFNNRIWNGGGTGPTQPAGSSGAYGIAQALPFNKMPKAAWPPGYGGSSSPSAQIAWGLGYIQATYGTPSAAWTHETSQGWY